MGMEVLSSTMDGCQDFMPGVACSGEKEVESIEKPHAITQVVLEINMFPSITRTVNAVYIHLK